MRGWIPLIILGLMLAVPSTAAGTRENPEVSDPANDLRYQGAPVPAGFEWADIRHAWFETHDSSSLVLTIEVVGAQGPPPRGEVGVTFRIGEQHWIAGWTVFPPLYSGGFLSKSDKNGDVPAGVSPSNAQATWTASRIVVNIPLATVAGDDNLTLLEEPNGWSESHATQGRMYRLDETVTGASFQIRPSPPQRPTSTGPTPTSEATSSPGFGFLAIAVTVAAVGSYAHRRRSD